MGRKPSPALLPPALASVMLVAFLVSGLVTGVLAHGLATSLKPVATPIEIVRATTTPPRPTPTATLAAITPTTPFDLTLAASPVHVQLGGSLALTVKATSGGYPLASLECRLGASRYGGAPLLVTWPTDQVTDVTGAARWNVTAPRQAGTYTVQVSANGSNHYSAWGFATVYVG